MGSRLGPVGGEAVDALFHDEQFDGPSPQRMRVLVLALAAERPLVAAKVAGMSDVDLVGVQDVPDMLDSGESAGEVLAGGRPEQQLAMLAVRLEMAAVYLRLTRG